MAGNLDGFGVYAKANSTERYDEDFYVLNQFNGDLTNNLFEDGAKVCRRPINGKDVINRIVLEYSDGKLTTMIKEKDGLHYCESRTIDLKEFYLTLSGKSQASETISIEVPNVYFKTDHEIPEIQYWPETASTYYNAKDLFKSVHDNVKQENERIKIYRTKFRDILTKKPAQIFKLLFSSDQKISKKLVKDIESLDIISQQIKISLTAVTTTKGRMENKFGEYVTKISNWLESMADIYDGMEVEMDDIIKKLTALKINERIGEVSGKMKKVIGQLERMTVTSGLYSKNSGEITKFLKQISEVHKGIVSYRENLGQD